MVLLGGPLILVICRTSASAFLDYLIYCGLNSGMIFEISASEGAVLTMPVGSNSEDLTNKRLLRKYAAMNAEHWYRYIIDDQGREISNGDVRLVVGYDKTVAWGMATFSNLSAQVNTF